MTGGSRLTDAQCQAIADRTLRSLDALDAAEVLERFDIRESRVAGEVATDELTGKPFQRRIWAYAIGDEITLVVSVSPEPRVVRQARRFKLLAELIEGWRDGRETSISVKVLHGTRP